MKILIISTCPFFGGGENFIFTTLKQISGELFFLVKSQILFNKMNSDKVFLFNNTNFFFQLFEVLKIKNNINPDIIILNGGSSIYMATFIRGKKILYKHVTNESVPKGIKRFLYKILIIISVFFSKKIIHVSKYSMQQQKIFASKKEVIYHGINVNQIFPKRYLESDITTFLFVGRIHTSKGVEIICDTFKALANHQLKLILVGDFSHADFNVNKYRCNNILFYGFSDNCKEFYKRSDIFISLPEYEAFGLTILEAMSFGLPIITCNTGSSLELISHHKNGLIIDRNKTELLSSVLFFLNNKKKIKDYGIENQKKVKEMFNLEDTILKINFLLSKL